MAGDYLNNEETRKKAAEVSNHLITTAGIKMESDLTLTKVAVDGSGWNHQRKQDRKAKEGLDVNQANIVKAIQDNIPDGSGDSKGGKPKGGKIVGGILTGASVTRVVMELTNPDASKDAAEAHTEKAAEKMNKKPEDSPSKSSFIERMTNKLRE